MRITKRFAIFALKIIFMKSNANKEWRKRNPEKVKAHIAVNNAVRYGKMKRMPCLECGNKKSQAHHEDYSKPLEIKWLCAKCHKKVHHPNAIPQPKKKPLRLSWHKKTMPSEKRDLMLDKAVKLKKTMSYRDVAKEIGVSVSTVYKWINNPKYT